AVDLRPDLGHQPCIGPPREFAGDGYRTGLEGGDGDFGPRGLSTLLAAATRSEHGGSEGDRHWPGTAAGRRQVGRGRGGDRKRTPSDRSSALAASVLGVSGDGV